MNITWGDLPQQAACRCNPCLWAYHLPSFSLILPSKWLSVWKGWKDGPWSADLSELTVSIPRTCNTVTAFIKHVGVISKRQHCHSTVREGLYCCTSPACLPTCLPVLQVYELQPKAKISMPSPKISWCFCRPDGSNLRPTPGDVAVLSFFPETNKTCFSILLGLKYLSLFSQGRRGTPEATEGRKSLQGSTEVGHVLQLLIV